MRTVCPILDGKVTLPEEWLNWYEDWTGEKADKIVFDTSDNNPKVPAGAFLLRKQDSV